MSEYLKWKDQEIINWVTKEKSEIYSQVGEDEFNNGFEFRCGLEASRRFHLNLVNDLLGKIDNLASQISALAKENEELRAERSFANLNWSHEKKLHKHIAANLTAKLERAKSALEFYADEKNWLEIDGSDGCYEQIKDDSGKYTSIGGQLARQTLEELGDE